MLNRPHVRNAIALGMAIGVFGVAFGVLAVQAGLSPWRAQAMSLLVFTGGSQFAAIGVIDAGGTAAAAVGAALLLAVRNGVYGAALAARFGKRLRPRLIATQLVIDESTAMSAARDDDETAIEAFWAAGLSVFVFWNLGTAAGAWGGQIIGDPESLGLDAALPAGFVAMMLPLARSRRGRAAAFCGGVIALVAIPLVPPGLPVILAGLGVIPVLLLGHRLDEAEEPQP
jgi:4-azaleucine resistance transporter AzlC